MFKKVTNIVIFALIFAFLNFLYSNLLWKLFRKVIELKLCLLYEHFFSNIHQKNDIRILLISADKSWYVQYLLIIGRKCKINCDNFLQLLNASSSIIVTSFKVIDETDEHPLNPNDWIFFIFDGKVIDCNEFD